MIPCVYSDDYGRISPPPPHIAWLAMDIAPRYLSAFKSCLDRGWVLVLASAGRTPEVAIAKHGKPDGHQAGRAIDVSFATMKRWYYDFNIQELDGILGTYGFHPLGSSRWPNPEKGIKGDPQHYQTDDYGGLRKIGKQRFTDLEKACEWVGNKAGTDTRART